MSSEVMNVAALGRPFTLGMLYDARRDELIPGLTLWDLNTLKEKTVETSKRSSNFKVSASDSIESKSSLMDIEASLKVSFLCGLVEVGGSAKYLNDKKKFKNQSRVTCRYNATTHFNQLSVTQGETMSTQQKDVIKKTTATHVVTGILYGADVFFVFDSEKLEVSSVQDIQGHMEAVIKKIPSFNVEGQVDIKLTEEEKELTNKFSCKFYGDFILQSNPATFIDAVKTYVELPKLLGEDGEKSVPVKVWMMPLKVFDTTAAELMKEISVGLVWKVQDALEDLREIQMRCNDSLHDTVVQKLPQIQEELNKFQNCCNRYVSNLQTNMAKKLPSIREGKDDESSVKKLLDDRNKSPFSHEKLDKWLDHKEREINIIRSCVEIMEGTKIVHNQSELDREVLAAGVNEALCFVFTSLQSADPILDEMDQYLDSPSGSTIEDLDSLRGSTNEVPWYYSDEVLTKMREKAKYFQDIAKSLKSNSRRDLLQSSDELRPREHKSSFTFLPPNMSEVSSSVGNFKLGTTDFNTEEEPDGCLRAQNALEGLRGIQMRCNDSLNDTVVENLPQIQKKLSKFQNCCNRYVSNLQTTMAKKPLSIREGTEDESSVEKLLDDRNKSPFSHEKLDEWLDHKEREINVIRSCVEMMEGTMIVRNQSELDREVLAAGVDEALCFVFTSLQSADPGLDEMEKYLDSLRGSTKEVLDSLKGSTNEVPWYYSDEVLTKMRKKAKYFQDTAKSLKSNSRVCFLVAAITNEKHTGATIYHYRNGILLTEDFSKPDIPDVETVTDRRDLLWPSDELQPREHRSSFRFLPPDCFLVAAITNEKHIGATIYHYRNGKLLNEDFSKPDIPDVETVTDIRDLLWSSDELRPREHKSSFLFLPPTMSEVSSSVGNFKLGTTDFNTEEEPDGCLRAQNALEGLREIQMRCNDSLNDTVVENLPQIQKKLSKFQNCCNHYVSNLQTTMAKKPLSIREGTEDESSVEKLLDDRNKSPFSHEKLDEWLDHKEREINVIRSCVEMMEGTKIVRNQSELDREVLAAGVNEALCFVFTSLQSADPGLDEMDQYLDSLRGSTKEVLDSLKGSTNEVPWYYSDEVLTKMRKKAKYFQDTAKSLKSNSRVCFLVAAITNEKHTGATIYHYRNGILLTEDFSKPDIPDVETVTDRRDLLWPSDELQPREHRSSFRFLPPDCFLVTAITNEKHTGATIYHYRNGILLTEDFSKPNIPDVETVTDRRDLLRHACDLTLDPETASYSLTLSEGNKKVTHGPGQSNPDLPQRLDYFAHVLCKEELTGRRYWEVEWKSSKVNVTAGVCYRGMERKGDSVQSILGRNKLSWCLGYVQIPGPEVLSAEHDNHKDCLSVPSPFTHLGVYLDWSAGTLSYYNVSSDTVSHIYTFRTKFTEPVYPGFGIWDGSSASLCL